MSQCPSQEVLKLALDALENSIDLVSNDAKEAELLYGKYQSRLAKVKGLVALEVAHGKAIAAIKEALAQPEQEPVAYPDGDVVGPCICGSWPGGKCLKCPRITTPPQRQWVGLTDDEKQAAYIIVDGWSNCIGFIEKTLREKNK